MALKIEDLNTALYEDKSLAIFTDWYGYIGVKEDKLTDNHKALLEIMDFLTQPPSFFVGTLDSKANGKPASNAVMCLSYSWDTNFDGSSGGIYKDSDEGEADITGRNFKAIQNVVTKSLIPLIEAALGDKVEAARGYFGYCSTGMDDGDHEFMLVIPYNAPEDKETIISAAKVMASNYERIVAETLAEYMRLTKIEKEEKNNG